MAKFQSSLLPQDQRNGARVINDYDEDWCKLAYVLIFGKARVLKSGAKHRKAVNLLRKKYPQYRAMKIHQRPIIQITPTRSTSWGAL